MEKKIKKLVFNKEVIKRLNKSQLGEIAGASFKTITAGCPSVTCTCYDVCGSIIDTWSCR